MKQFATRKEIKRIYDVIINVPYTGLQNLLIDDLISFYNSGSSGWNWDCYDLGNGLAVCTGYSNRVGEKLSREFIKSFDDKAKEELRLQNFTSVEAFINKQKELIAEFREEALKVINA